MGFRNFRIKGRQVNSYNYPGSSIQIDSVDPILNAPSRFVTGVGGYSPYYGAPPPSLKFGCTETLIREAHREPPTVDP